MIKRQSLRLQCGCSLLNDATCFVESYAFFSSTHVYFFSFTLSFFSLLICCMIEFVYLVLGLILILILLIPRHFQRIVASLSVLKHGLHMWYVNFNPPPLQFWPNKRSEVFRPATCLVLFLVFNLNVINFPLNVKYFIFKYVIELFNFMSNENLKQSTITKTCIIYIKGKTLAINLQGAIDCLAKISSKKVCMVP